MLRAADAHDLLHEAVEEDRVTRLVHLLGRQEVLLLLERSGVDVRGEPVGDGVLAPEEERVVPDRGLALEVREVGLPLLARRVVKSISMARQLPRSHRA